MGKDNITDLLNELRHVIIKNNEITINALHKVEDAMDLFQELRDIAILNVEKNDRVFHIINEFENITKDTEEK